MDQQCKYSAVVKYNMKCSTEVFNALLGLFILYIFSQNRHWSIVWWMTICWNGMLDQLSVSRRLNLSTSRTGYHQMNSCSTAKIL